jgi:hypothetical protein
MASLAGAASIAVSIIAAVVVPALFVRAASVRWPDRPLAIGARIQLLACAGLLLDRGEAQHPRTDRHGGGMAHVTEHLPEVLSRFVRASLDLDQKDPMKGWYT